MVNQTNTGKFLQRIFSAVAAVLFGSILVNALITLVTTKEMTNAPTIVMTMLFVIVMVLDKKDLFATVGVGCFALWKIIAFFLGGSLKAMWFELAAAVALLYLTFLVSRREVSKKDLHTAGLFGWVPGVLAAVGFFFYLSYACNDLPMRYWIYSIENGQRINLHYIGLKLIEVLGIVCAGLWTAFAPVDNDEVAPIEAAGAEETDDMEQIPQEQPAEQTEQADAPDGNDAADAQ